MPVSLHQSLCLCHLQAIQGLNGMQLGDKKLVVQRASVGAAKIITGEGAEIAAASAAVAMPVTNVPMPINIPGLQVSGIPFSLLFLFVPVPPHLSPRVPQVGTPTFNLGGLHLYPLLPHLSPRVPLVGTPTFHFGGAFIVPSYPSPFSQGPPSWDPHL